MTESQVIEILGRPDESTTHPQMRSLRFIEWDDDSRVTFENGKVYAVIYKDEIILDEDEDPSIE